MLHPANAHGARRLSLPRLLPIVLIVLAFGLGLSAVSWACGDPPPPALPPPDVWIIIDDGNVWIIIRGFSIHAVSSGAFCGCGINLPISMAKISSAELVNTATQQIVPGFSFVPNPGTTQSLQGFGSNYQGFLTEQALPTVQGQPQPQFEFVFHGTLGPGIGFDNIARELRQASNPFASGEANSDGSFEGTPGIVEDIDQVDPTNTSAGAPVARIARMNAAAPGSAEVAVQDSGAGLSLVMVLGASNASARVASFPHGKREPVGVDLTLTDAKSPGKAEIKACNLLGRCTISRFALMPMELGEDPTLQQVMEMASTQSRFHFQNGEPGVRMLALSVEGKRFSVRPLASGQILEGDLSAAVRSGTNRLTCSVRGPAGARGLLVLSSLP